MCTLSWWANGEHRGLFFNRDEKRTRSEGIAPTRLSPSKGVVEILAPSDPDSGGSWIGVNTGGLSIALLNNYPFHQEDFDRQISRGQLVLKLLRTADSTIKARRQLEALDLTFLKGFVIFFMDRETLPVSMGWDGTKLREENLQSQCLVSSSLRKEACQEYRRKLIETADGNREDLARMHQHHNAKDSALGPLMVRHDARTQSITEVEISPDHAVMHYWRVNESTPSAEFVSTTELNFSTSS